MSVAIVTDSTASLSAEDAAHDAITVVPTTVIIGSKIHTEGVDVDGRTIAEALAERRPISTSRPAPETFQAIYANLASAGATEIVSVHLSAKVSGTIDSARLAASRVDVPVHVVDSGQVGLATGFAAGAAARAAAAGASVEDVVAAAQWVGDHSTVLLYVDTLEYLKRGGRIGSAAALIGSALAVKPILTIAGGEVAPLEKVRTKNRALARLVALAVEAANDAGESYDIGVQHLTAPDVADGAATRLAAALGLPSVAVDEVGADIGAHVGPGMIAVTVSAHPQPS